MNPEITRRIELKQERSEIQARLWEISSAISEARADIVHYRDKMESSRFNRDKILFENVIKGEESQLKLFQAEEDKLLGRLAEIETELGLVRKS